jgi:hypothetical protein
MKGLRTQDCRLGRWDLANLLFGNYLDIRQTSNTDFFFKKNGPMISILTGVTLLLLLLSFFEKNWCNINKALHQVLRKFFVMSQPIDTKRPLKHKDLGLRT